MDKDKKGFIRYLKNSENLSISGMARRVNADRKTVSRALAENNQNRRGKRPSQLDLFKEPDLSDYDILIKKGTIK